MQGKRSTRLFQGGSWPLAVLNLAGVSASELVGGRRRLAQPPEGGLQLPCLWPSGGWNSEEGQIQERDGAERPLSQLKWNPSSTVYLFEEALG